MSELDDVLKRWDSKRSEHVINRIRSESDDVALFVDAARRYANPEDELWWCKAHARAIDTFDGLTPKTCLYDGRPGHCDPASALIVLGVTTEDDE